MFDSSFVDVLVDGLSNGDSGVFLLVTLLLGLANIQFVNWVRAALSKMFKRPVDDRAALVVVLAMSVVLAVAQLWSTGQLDDLTFNTLVANTSVIGLSAKFFYKWLKYGKKPEEQPTPKK